MSYLDKTNIRPSTRLGKENCNMEYKICIIDFIMATRVFPSMSENCALLVIRHLMYQMVKTAEEADAACEFITNLANNLKPKLVREEANYLVYESNMLLLLEQYYNNHRLQY
ncbi:hypothetical protein V1477_005734 [Vespula maculifrons]|uniref:Uncharacterized protein n=1 Tax=Vespula maculifrons TaxID=7453 RepID=A0ABD2CLV5_VESMC